MGLTVDVQGEEGQKPSLMDLYLLIDFDFAGF